MRTPGLPPDEKARLQRLNDLRTLHTPAEYRFDRITALARRIFDVPISLITLIAAQYQWFKSAQGITFAETPREVSFCGHAILQPDMMIVPDALEDERFADNPLVTGGPCFRFYAGQPLFHHGSALGTLCVIDTRPRDFAPEDQEALGSLAAWVENELMVESLSTAQRQLIRERDELRRAALIDPLTQSWNSRAQAELLERELALARRAEQDVALLLVEIDRFDAINGLCGRDTGDALLREVAQRLRAGGRPQDFLARIGASRFMLFVSDCSPEAATQRARCIVARIGAERLLHRGEEFVVTASVGVATALAGRGLNTAALVAAVERALAAARASGGDGLHQLAV